MENWSEHFGIDFELIKESKDYFKLKWNLFWDQIGRIEDEIGGRIEGADYKYWFLAELIKNYD